jgi:phage tail-like protein
MEKYIGCNFSVLIAPMELRGNFSSVSGLGVTMEFDEYHEGGNFLEPIYLPKSVSYNNIVLQRGTMTFDPLTTWFSLVQAGVHTRFPMVITMMDASGKPVKIWTVMDAMPVKVDYSPMDALGDSVAVTTIEFVHGAVISIM